MKGKLINLSFLMVQFNSVMLINNIYYFNLSFGFVFFLYVQCPFWSLLVTSNKGTENLQLLSTIKVIPLSNWGLHQV